MAGIVIELEKEALKEDSDIIALLRKAYLVARKLKLKEFEEWVEHELNGYDNSDVPDYRVFRGELKAWNPYHGWIPVVIENDTGKLTIHEARDSIANLKNVYDKSGSGCAIVQFSGAKSAMLSKYGPFPTKYSLHISVNLLYNIFERVKTIILDWAITLEENGIIGEEMQFSDDEKKIAEDSTVINNYINNFFGNVQGTQVQQDTKDSLQEIDRKS